MITPNPLPKSDRSTLKRQPKRGHYDRECINQILDEALVLHVGFTVNQSPFVIPMSYGREGDRLYIHGSTASRLLQNLEQGVDLCATATLLDGLVIARSLFHYSMNYRSVVVFGRATLVESPEEKRHALKALVEHIVPGSWAQGRQPTLQELNATTVLTFPLNEGSAKIRTGDPVDDAADCALPIWAGQLPLNLTPGAPIPTSTLDPALSVPANLLNYRRGNH